MAIYFAMCFDIMLIILFVLSATLIYSLLMINVQGRTFELAIRRMLGTPRSSVIGLILIHAQAYGIPALLLGPSSPCAVVRMSLRLPQSGAHT